MKHALSAALAAAAIGLSLSNLWFSSALRALSAQHTAAAAESERLRKGIARLEQVRITGKRDHRLGIKGRDSLMPEELLRCTIDASP